MKTIENWKIIAAFWNRNLKNRNSETKSNRLNCTEIKTGKESMTFLLWKNFFNYRKMFLGQYLLYSFFLIISRFCSLEYIQIFISHLGHWNYQEKKFRAKVKANRKRRNKGERKRTKLEQNWKKTENYGDKTGFEIRGYLLNSNGGPRYKNLIKKVKKNRFFNARNHILIRITG